LSANETLKQLRRELGRSSILDFAQTYFPQYVTHKPAAFHEEICSLLMAMSDKRDSRFALAAPRGHAKSTLISFFYVIWSICYGKENCILILSATANQSEKLLSGVSAALVTNRLLREDFPEVFDPKAPAKARWTQEEIVTPNNIMVAARSVGQDFRGIKHDQYRPTLIILDDVDGEKNTYNAASREKVLNWFTSTVLNVKDTKKANFVAVGTLLHMDSLLNRLTRKTDFPDWEKRIYKAVIEFSPRTDLWQTWTNILFSRGEIYNDEAGFAAANCFFQDNKQAMLEGTKVLWEESEDYYALMKIKEIEGSFSFDSEKQNDPSNAKECRLNPEKFTYWDDQYSNVDQLLESFARDYLIIGACDPSVGTMKTGADPSAIIILAKHKGKLYVLDADIKPRPQDDLVQAIVTFCKIRRPMNKFVIEANLFPELLLKTVCEKAYQENVSAPFKEVRNTGSKELRIFGMETYISTGQILFSHKHGELLDQMKYFPRGDHDDGPDALEMALREAELHQKGFEGLTDVRDRHGRDINHPDFGLTTPQEDSKDAEDDDGDNPFFSASTD
jgi:predicted phage terminase large subunit-like protein